MIRGARRALVPVVAALALAGCTASPVDPGPTTTSASPSPTATRSATAAPERATLDAATRRDLRAVISRHPDAQVSLAVAPVGGSGAPAVVGRDEALPAWSTIKVPLALAATRAAPDDSTVEADVELALTASDNDAALRLWQGLGSPRRAQRAVEDVLADGGDRRTTVQRRSTVAGFSPFGQTRWRASDQARFVAGAVCLRDAESVTDPMGRVLDWQAWGVGRLDGSLVKGGWGPTDDGYVARQLGVMGGAKGEHVAVTMTIRTSSYERGSALGDELAEVLQEHAGDLPGGRCEKASHSR